MYAIEVHRFGGPEVLERVESPTPEPGPGEVVVRLLSIGMNHADLMQRAMADTRLRQVSRRFRRGSKGVASSRPSVRAFHPAQSVIVFHWGSVCRLR